MIPLALRIRKGVHKIIAQAQDIIIQEIYSIFDAAVFHGGTAIWRCYGGNRFSEDIDVYIPNERDINTLFANLEKRGFVVKKKKISANSFYSDLIWNRAHIRLEGLFKKVQGHLKEYQTIEGNFVTVYTLTPEEFIEEKIKAYLSRRKIRDLYDVFFLLRFVSNHSLIKPHIEKLKKEFKQPVDEKDLKVLIIEGLVPSSQKMFEYVKNKTWER